MNAEYAIVRGMKKTSLLLVAVLALLPSCAYMQTHKNIEEMGCTYEGSELTGKNLSLHRKGNQWYLGSPLGVYEKNYPIIHDDVFDRDNNDPTYTAISLGNSRIYHPISSGTAACLMRDDGYAQTNALVTEILTLQKDPLTDLRGASTHSIRAEIAESASPAIIIRSRAPEETPLLNSTLSILDMCTVDLIGTCAYNCAVPLMAPVRFFIEFFSED